MFRCPLRPILVRHRQTMSGEGARLSESEALPRWSVIGASARGASHIRTGIPNQDAVGWTPDGISAPPCILAVSDGHGSAKCIRSDKGSRLAVETALAVMSEFAEGLPDLPDLSLVKRSAEKDLPRGIVREWMKRVAVDLLGHPLNAQEMGRIANSRHREHVVLNPAVAYGATLLAVLVMKDSMLYLQLGDGDVLVVSENGSVTRPPLPRDERLFADETTSLCSKESWNDFRVYLQVPIHSQPALILLSTDGYANSFSTESDFLQVGRDLFVMIRSNGLDVVSGEITEWLSETSKEGSGDDVTLGVLCRVDAAEAPTGTVPRDSLVEETGPPTEQLDCQPQLGYDQEKES